MSGLPSSLPEAAPMNANARRICTTQSAMFAALPGCVWVGVAAMGSDCVMPPSELSILLADPSPARDRFGCKSSGRRRFQRPGKHVAERLGRPAAQALDVAGHNVERTRREARLDADDGVDDLRRQTNLRQSGAQLLFRDDKERERPASD